MTSKGAGGYFFDGPERPLAAAITDRKAPTPSQRVSLVFRWWIRPQESPQSPEPSHCRWSEAIFLERTTGLEPATPILAIAWWMSHASPSVSPVSLSCVFLALLSHASQQIARVASISLVISLEQTSRGRILG
jgi:hypothetical protein